MKRFTLLLLTLASLQATAQGKFFGGDSPSSYTGTPISLGVLPVELTSLSAYSTDKGVRVAWETANEINNDYFQVEAFTAGAFRSIGRVSGSGTTASPKSYSFLDTSPAHGINLYRLRQFDHDGSTELSSVVSASFLLTTPKIYPNPTVGPLFMNTTLTNARVTVHDLSGRVVMRFDEGRVMDISSLRPGFYLLRIDLEDEELVLKVGKK